MPSLPSMATCTWDGRGVDSQSGVVLPALHFLSIRQGFLARLSQALGLGGAVGTEAVDPRGQQVALSILCPP